MDYSLIKYAIEIAIYVITFGFSAIAVKAIPFHKFLDHTKVKESWLLYLLVVLALTFLVGTLIINFIGLDIWLPSKLN